eukprot:373905-Amorphochlora_amoeboformis.AAC.1
MDVGETPWLPPSGCLAVGWFDGGCLVSRWSIWLSWWRASCMLEAVVRCVCGRECVSRFESVCGSVRGSVLFAVDGGICKRDRGVQCVGNKVGLESHAHGQALHDAIRGSGLELDWYWYWNWIRNSET